MGFSVGTLTDYVDERKEELYSRSQFMHKTGQMLLKDGNVQTGVKDASAVNILATTATLQDNAACGFNSGDTTTISQKVITVAKLKVQESWCVNDLEPKYTQKYLAAGSNYDDLGEIEALIFDDKLRELAEVLEVKDWQGAVGAASYDGLQVIIAAGSPVVEASVVLSATTIRPTLQGMLEKLPSGIVGQDDLIFACGYDTLTLYTNKLANDNLFHISGQTDRFDSISVENSNVTMEAFHGLDGTDDIYAFRKSNLHMGVDLEGEESDFRVWYSMDDDVVKYSIKFKRGLQVGFGTEVVQFLGT